MEGRKKEKVVFRTVCLLVAILLVGPSVNSLQTGAVLNQESIEQDCVKELEIDFDENKHGDTTDTGDYQTIVIETNPIGSSLPERTEIEISKEDYNSFINEYEELLSSDNHQFIDNKVFALFKKYGILSETATVENLKETANEISEFVQEKYSLNDFTDIPPGRKGPSFLIDETFVGLGCSFIFATLMNSIAPVAWPPDAVWPLINEDITFNFLGKDVTISAIGTCGFATFDLLVGQSINFGWVHSMIPLRELIFMQPFYGVLIFPAGVSLTIYLKSNPPIILFDAIVGACVVGNLITFKTCWGT